MKYTFKEARVGKVVFHAISCYAGSTVRMAAFQAADESSILSRSSGQAIGQNVVEYEVSTRCIA